MMTSAPRTIRAITVTGSDVVTDGPGTRWWDDVLLSDPTWFIPGRAVGGQDDPTLP
jgi:hypothetical protein